MSSSRIGPNKLLELAAEPSIDPAGARSWVRPPRPGPWLTLAGCGPGAPELITPATRAAAVAARLLVGSERLLASFPEASAQRLVYRAKTSALLDALATGPRPACVLVSGDPGLCSLARPILKRFGRPACRVIPGISSVQAACAAAGVDWLGAMTLSCHGRQPPCVDLEVLRPLPLIAVLAGDPASVTWCAQLHAQLGDRRRIVLCERVTLPEERIAEVEVTALSRSSFHSLTVILLSKEPHA